MRTSSVNNSVETLRSSSGSKVNPLSISTQYERDSIDNHYRSFTSDKQKRRITTVRDIVNRPMPKIEKKKVNIKDQFQDVRYLKSIPKKIDCW